MTEQMLAKLLDACFVAKRVTESMLELPAGMKPRHVHVLHAINEKTKKDGTCCVSDVSTALNITTPSVTKLINELENRKLVEKRCGKQDRRSVLLYLTEEGQKLEQHYVTEYHREWCKGLQEVTDQEAGEVIRILNLLYKTVPKEEKRDGK